MAEQLEVLNTERHKALCMHAFASDRSSTVAIVIGEFTAAAAVCPIVLAKNPQTGAFFAAALFGFEPGEMLVEGALTGQAAFWPLDLQRRGFFVADDDIAIDVAHPRFGQGAGIALFDDGGQPGEELRRIQWALGQLKSGLEATEAFVADLLRLRLIEPISISLQFDDGEKIHLEGLYTVSRDRLNELDDADILALFRKGYLQAAYAISLSLKQINVLARRRNLRLAGKL